MMSCSRAKLCGLIVVVSILCTYFLGWWHMGFEKRHDSDTVHYRFVAEFNAQKAEEQHDPSEDFHSTQLYQNLTPQALVENYIPSEKGSDLFICSKLISGDAVEVSRALSPHSYRPRLQPKQYSEMTSDCDKFRTERHYTTIPLSQEEAEFPIAFSLVLFQDIELFERLLRAVYRPQNYYCIHVDLKSSDEYEKAVQDIASCFENVFVSSRSVDVQWGFFSVVEPELICMEELYKYKKWKYFINLTGQEFPLKTNWELVQILKSLNGANNMEGTIKRRNLIRLQYVHRGIAPTRIKKNACPIPGFTFTKGSVHIIAQRGFIDFILHNQDALTFREWIKDSGVPDETFFSTLNFSPSFGAPGAYLGEPETDKIDVDPPGFPRNPFIARFKNWGDGPFAWPCGGKRVRQICIMGIEDLPRLSTRKELFVNKFNSDFQPEAYDCLEELHYIRTRQQVLEGGTRLDLDFYRRLDIVQNHVKI